MNDSQRHSLSLHKQTHIHTSAGYIASMLLLLYNKQQTTGVDYQVSYTKLLSFASFHNTAYNTSRRFLYIPKNLNHSEFIANMKSMCRKQLIFGLEMNTGDFKHCFLVVGQIRASFVLVTRNFNSPKISWALIDEQAVRTHDVSLLIVHDPSTRYTRKCPRYKKTLHPNVCIPAPFPLYDRYVYKYS